MVRLLRWIALLGAGVAVAAAAAHVLELPNKMTLDGPLWLAVQQRLYRGWGPILGPFEVAGAAAAWALAWCVRERRVAFALVLGAAICQTIALVAFFLVVQPVNGALAQWTPATLPDDWSAHRLRWELGHALRFVFLLTALVAQLRGAAADLAAAALPPAQPIPLVRRRPVRARR
ncbi:MAG: DUF1772 domain-containing protein [Proteobacteria bacterium]|nr:MAG: DUF1772 domain-containing protein [Pseudomonadota bacterium]